MQEVETDLEIDTRPIFSAGDTPCQIIDDAISRLKAGQRIVITVPFEPIPLYSKFRKIGFTHDSIKMDQSTWRVTFTPPADLEEKRESCGRCGCSQ